MNKLFSKFDSRIVTSNINNQGIVGKYDPEIDTIVIDKSVMRLFPTMRKIIILHEMFHSTLPDSRTNRIERLVSKLGRFGEGTLSYKTEECIAEICTMVASKKLGILNQYSSIVIEDGLKKNYTEDMIIPWMEVVSAIRYYCDDSIDFTEELNYVKCYLKNNYNMKIRRSYDYNSIV